MMSVIAHTLTICAVDAGTAWSSGGAMCLGPVQCILGSEIGEGWNVRLAVDFL